MSEELTHREQLLMWDLFASGGAKLLKDIVPKPVGSHTALARKGYLSITPDGPRYLLTLEDRGWRWIADCDPFPIADGETRVTAERRLLQSFARGIKRHAASSGKTVQELFRADPPASKPPPARTARKQPKEPAEPLADAIRRAFFALAGHPPREGVRLSALRATLADVGRAELDAALLAMRKSRAINLMNLDNPRDIAGEEAAELRSGRQVFHLLWIDA